MGYLLLLLAITNILAFCHMWGDDLAKGWNAPRIMLHGATGFVAALFFLVWHIK